MVLNHLLTRLSLESIGISEDWSQIVNSSIRVLSFAILHPKAPSKVAPFEETLRWIVLLAATDLTQCLDCSSDNSINFKLSEGRVVCCAKQEEETNTSARSTAEKNTRIVCLNLCLYGQFPDESRNLKLKKPWILISTKYVPKRCFQSF